MTADLGERPELHSVGGYISALGVLADYAIALAVYSPDWTQSASEDRTPSFADRLHRMLYISVTRDARAYRHDLLESPKVAVDRLRLASPLETVLTSVASDVKPIGYAVAAMALLKSALGTVMDWQRHRAELRQMDRGGYPDLDPGEGESTRFTDEAFVQLVISEMQERSGIPVRETTSEDLIRAVRRIVSVPVVKVQGDGEPASSGPR